MLGINVKRGVTATLERVFQGGSEVLAVGADGEEDFSHTHFLPQ